jgi:radical SAM superfamily enzyme YgiQ (UPF0313 family)
VRVLLINPPFPDSYWGFKHALKFERKRSAYPPLGLLTVSALLPNDWKRQLVDCEVEKLQPADIQWADMVFVTGMLIQKEALHGIVDLCKAHGKIVAVGGPYVSTATEGVPNADHIFIGEVEETLPEFIEDLRRGAARKLYRSSEKPQLTSSPIPDFGLANLKYYSAMSVQYSRGCPFDCEFCDIIEIFGRVPRTKSIDQTLAELDALFAAGWRGTVFVVDDNFIGNKRSVKQLLPRLIEWQERKGRPFVFITEASVNLADDSELLAGMHRAGFYRVFLGIETPVKVSLMEAQKTQNTRGSLLAAVRTIQSHGIEVMAGFIVGFDSDPEDVFERQIKFIRQSAIPLAMVGMLTALPDTSLWRRLHREGRLIKESSGSNAEWLNFIPKMEMGRLIAGHKSILRTIYDPREYYNRALRLLKRMPAGQSEPSMCSFLTAITILARVIVRLGIIDGERLEFWRFMRGVMLKQRGRLVHAVRLAIMGYHFRKLPLPEQDASCSL